MSKPENTLAALVLMAGRTAFPFGTGTGDPSPSVPSASASPSLAEMSTDATCYTRHPLPDLYIDGAGIDTNRSEFIKEACRGHPKALKDDAAIAALRLEQLLAKAEQSQQRDSDIEAKLAEPGEQVDPGDLEQ